MRTIAAFGGRAHDAYACTLRAVKTTRARQNRQIGDENV
jgi:hypothetical protein